MNLRLNAALILAAAFSLAGCIPNDASVRVFGVCAIPDTGCKFAPTCGTLYIGDFVMDIGNPSQSFVWPIQLDNQRPDNVDRDGGTSTSNAWVEGYKLDFTTNTPGVTIPSTTVSVTSSPILPKGSSVALALIVPPSVGDYLNGLAGSLTPVVTIQLVAIGRYGDGSSFETGPFTVEVNTCRGCIGLHDVAPLYDPICATTDPGPPVVVTPGSIEFICPNDGQTAFYSCKK
jgi:hypothetical protein